MYQFEVVAAAAVVPFQEATTAVLPLPPSEVVVTPLVADPAMVVICYWYHFVRVYS